MIRSHVGDVMSALAGAKSEALESIGELAETYAKDKCPVRTGRLRNSITYRADDERVVVGTDVEYGPAVEFGTVSRKAQPFIAPALTGHVATYRSALQDAMKNAG